MYLNKQAVAKTVLTFCIPHYLLCELAKATIKLEVKWSPYTTFG